MVLPKQRDKCRLGNEERAASCPRYVDPKWPLLKRMPQRHKPPCRKYACLCGNAVYMLREAGVLARREGETRAALPHHLL